MNEEIIANINKNLNKFWLGDYKEEATYPLVFTKSKLTTGKREAEFNISCRVHKNPEGMLRRVMFTINKYPNT